MGTGRGGMSVILNRGCAPFGFRNLRARNDSPLFNWVSGSAACNFNQKTKNQSLSKTKERKTVSFPTIMSLGNRFEVAREPRRREKERERDITKFCGERLVAQKSTHDDKFCTQSRDKNHVHFFTSIFGLSASHPSCYSAMDLKSQGSWTHKCNKQETEQARGTAIFWYWLTHRKVVPNHKQPTNQSFQKKLQRVGFWISIRLMYSTKESVEWRLLLLLLVKK